MFADGTTVHVHFCPGDHQLSNSLRLDMYSVQNLTFQGSSNSSININPSVDITLVNIVISTLQSITLISSSSDIHSILILWTHKGLGVVQS